MTNPLDHSTSRRSLLTGGLGAGALTLLGATGITAASTAEASSKGYQAMMYAYSHAGAPYVLGAKGPKKFDCSGLVQYSLRQRGISVPPGTYQQAFEARNHIRPRAGRGQVRYVGSHAVPGDLVFFYTANGFPDHVGFWTGRDIFDAYRPGYGAGHRPLSMYRFPSCQAFMIV